MNDRTVWKKAAWRACAVLLFLLSASPTIAATWYVGSGATGSGASAADPAPLAFAVAKAASGDELILDNGTYALTATLTISNDVVIQGSGASIIDCAAAGRTCLRVRGNVTFTELLIENAPAGSRAIALKIENAAPVIDDVEFSSNHIAVQISGTISAPEIMASVFDSNAYGIMMLAGSGTVIQGSSFEANTSVGIFIQAASLATVSGNTFNSNDTGIWLKDVFGSVTATVERNTFDANRYAIRTEGTTSGTGNIISGNAISSSTVAGINASGTLETSTIESNICTGNTIGITIATGATSHVLNNLITNALLYGIRSTGATPTIGFNTIAYSTNHGFASRSADNSLVANNIFYANGGYGVSVDGASSATRIGNNDFYLNCTGTYLGGTDLGTNLTADPLFIGGGDYGLQNTSSMIDAGDTTLISVTSDIQDNTRVIVTSGGTTAADIGAYEKIYQKN